MLTHGIPPDFVYGAEFGVSGRERESTSSIYMSIISACALLGSSSFVRSRRINRYYRMRMQHARARLAISAEMSVRSFTAPPELVKGVVSHLFFLRLHSILRVSKFSKTKERFTIASHHFREPL